MSKGGRYRKGRRPFSQYDFGHADERTGRDYTNPTTCGQNDQNHYYYQNSCVNMNFDLNDRIATKLILSLIRFFKVNFRI